MLKKSEGRKFLDISCEVVENAEQYETLRRKVEDKVTVEGKLDYYKMLDMQVNIQNEIEKLEHQKDISMSVNLPCATILPGGTLGVLASYFLLDNSWSVCDAIKFIAVLMLFLFLLISISRNILKVRRKNLLFYNTIKKILDRAIEREQKGQSK